jgi:hypothetical protein
MEGVPYVSGQHVRFRMEPPPEAAIARLAARQYGVVSLTQLKKIGLSGDAVHKRAARYRLHRVYRGVYAVGHPRLTSEGRWMAAVLAYGPEAALSHRSSAAHRGLRPDNRATTDISLPRRSARTRAGVRVHATTTLRPEDVSIHDGIPLHHRRAHTPRPRGSHKPARRRASRRAGRGAASLRRPRGRGGPRSSRGP